MPETPAPYSKRGESMLLQRKSPDHGPCQQQASFTASPPPQEQGARLAFNYVGEAIKKRVEPLSEELGGEFTFQCDVCDDGQIADAAALVKDNWGDLDILVHSVAFANREDLNGRFLDTSRDGFKLALEVSAFSLTALCRAFEPLLHDGSSVMTMTYHGSTQIIPGYNVMGVAKSALEASVRYLAYDLGPAGVRVNAISPAPSKTLAASAVSSLKDIFTLVENHAPFAPQRPHHRWAAPPPSWPRIPAHAVTGQVLYVDSGFSKMGVPA